MHVPYAKSSDLPGSVCEHLPAHAQAIFRAAYNSAWDEYADAGKRRGGESREEAAFKVAWTAVKHKYKKDERTERWRSKARMDHAHDGGEHGATPG